MTIRKRTGQGGQDAVKRNSEDAQQEEAKRHGAPPVIVVPASTAPGSTPLHKIGSRCSGLGPKTGIHDDRGGWTKFRDKSISANG